MGQQKGKSMKRPRVRLQERVAAVIRRHREAGKWTQDAFAAHIEMHRAQYSIMEEGRKDVRLSTLERVANGLQVPMWEILREAEGS
jgi:transcriptional regulator with XRE-family HTH domain